MILPIASWSVGRLSRTRPSGTSQFVSLLNVSTPSNCAGESVPAAASAAAFESSIAGPYMLHERSSTMDERDLRLVIAIEGDRQYALEVGPPVPELGAVEALAEHLIPADHQQAAAALLDPRAERRHRLRRELRAPDIAQHDHVQGIERVGRVEAAPAAGPP